MPDEPVVRKHSTRYPYKVVERFSTSAIASTYWPASSDEHDNTVIGDGNPGDRKSAELCVRCCNIAYRHAIEDVVAKLAEMGVDIPALRKLAQR